MAAAPIVMFTSAVICKRRNHAEILDEPETSEPGTGHRTQNCSPSKNGPN